MKSAPKIFCFTQVRDEIDIIEDWILYHVALFGSGNVHVIDHDSTDGTENILKKYEGHIVLHDPVDRGPRNKGVNISHLLNEYAADADFLVPIDADEFVATQNSCDPAVVQQKFFTLNEREELAYIFPLQYEAIPAKNSTSAVDGFTRFCIKSFRYANESDYFGWKVFFASGSKPTKVNCGNHACTPLVRETDLWLYHYSIRSLAQLRKKAVRALEWCGHWQGKFEKKGSHLKYFWEMEQQGRLAEVFDKFAGEQPVVHSDKLSRRLKQLRAESFLDCRQVTSS